MYHIGAIILAAGASTRMGQPKQLLKYQGTSLIRRITGIAIDVVHEPVVVVTGAYSDLISGELKDLPARVVKNPDWTTGLASSIHTGMTAFRTMAPQIGALFFLVCDQPFVSAHLLREMIHSREKSGKPIVACSYNDTLGTPVLISSMYFKELLQLRLQEGAKKLIQRHQHAVHPVSFPDGHVDIDTVQDYLALQSKNY